MSRWRTRPPHGNRNRDGGVTLSVQVPGAGTITGDDAGAKGRAAPRSGAKAKDLVKAARATTAQAGTVELRLRPSKKAKRKLAKGKAVKAKVAVTFAPDGGTAATQTIKLKLKKPRKK